MSLDRTNLLYCTCNHACNGHWAGLVWHTDAATWQEGEDSDPDLVDFDMDTRIHYKYGPKYWSLVCRGAYIRRMYGG